MPPPKIRRPFPEEYPSTYEGYLATVAGDDATPLLSTQGAEVERVVGGLSEEQARHRYAPGKWSVKEVIAHLADNERVFAYRALRFARGDPTPLANFDENRAVEAAQFDSIPMATVLDDFRSVRAATRSLVATLHEDALGRVGIARGHPVSVRALIWVCLGHVNHHLGVLSDRYGIR